MAKGKGYKRGKARLIESSSDDEAPSATDAADATDNAATAEAANKDLKADGEGANEEDKSEGGSDNEREGGDGNDSKTSDDDDEDKSSNESDDDEDKSSNESDDDDDNDSGESSDDDDEESEEEDEDEEEDEEEYEKRRPRCKYVLEAAEEDDKEDDDYEDDENVHNDDDEQCDKENDECNEGERCGNEAEDGEPARDKPADTDNADKKKKKKKKKKDRNKDEDLGFETSFAAHRQVEAARQDAEHDRWLEGLLQRRGSRKKKARDNNSDIGEFEDNGSDDDRRCMMGAGGGGGGGDDDDDGNDNDDEGRNNDSNSQENSQGPAMGSQGQPPGSHDDTTVQTDDDVNARRLRRAMYLQGDLEEHASNNQDKEARAEQIKRRQEEELMRMEEEIQKDPQCSNRWSRSLVMNDIRDIQVDPNVDGYVYAFTSVANGPVVTKEAYQQILCLLTVIHSFVPRECILQTEYLRPTFKDDGLLTLHKKVELSEEEIQMEMENRRKTSKMLLSERPFDVVRRLSGNDRIVDGGSKMLGDNHDNDEPAAADNGYASFKHGNKGSSHHQQQQESLLMGRPDKYTWEVVDVADILLAPVCVTHATEDFDDSCMMDIGGNDDEEKDPTSSDEYETKKITSFWMVMLKTRKCYNFLAHLQWLVERADAEDKSNMKNAMQKQFEGVMDMLRNVLLHQYEMNANFVGSLRESGHTTRLDPLKRLQNPTMCTTDSIDQVCSLYEAYMNMKFHVQKEDSRRKILHVSGFSDTMLFTADMDFKSLARQREWYAEFHAEKERIKEANKQLAKAQSIKDPIEKEAVIAELTRELQAERYANLPPPILYPIPREAMHYRQAASSSSSASGKGNRQRGKHCKQGGDPMDCDPLPRPPPESPDVEDNDMGCVGDEGENGDKNNDDEEDSFMKDVVFDEYDEYGGGGERKQESKKTVPDDINKNEYDDYADDDEDDDDDAEELQTGIPNLPLIMRVDIQGKFVKESCLMKFQNKFGGLPAMASIMVLDMMYQNSMRPSPMEQLSSIMLSVGNLPPRAKSMIKRRRNKSRAAESSEGDSSAAAGGGKGAKVQEEEDLLPLHLFLPKPEIIQAHTRKNRFKQDVSTMEGFRIAGCDLHILNRVMEVIRSTKDSVKKVAQFYDYLRRVHKQHVSSVLNNELLSNNAKYAVTYLEQAKGEVCNDLRALIRSELPNFYDFMIVDKVASRMQGRVVQVVKEEANALVSFCFVCMCSVCNVCVFKL